MMVSNEINYLHLFVSKFIHLPNLDLAQSVWILPGLVVARWYSATRLT